jgi:isoleucyl-tRNA synthetase
LHAVLAEICKLIAPFVPYLAEELYQGLTGAESVHLTDYPQSDPSYIDAALEERMQAVIDVVSLGRTARGECQIKIRQPLGTMYVPARLRASIQAMPELVKEEVNIHNIEYVEEDSDFVQYELKPQFKVMGPKFGNKMKAIAAALAKVNGADALRAFAKEGGYNLHMGDENISLVPEDLLVQILPREGYVFASMKDIFVALDTTLTEALIREGYARELINKIQYSRKEQGFEIMDRVQVNLTADEEVRTAVEEYRDYIMNETLCDAIDFKALEQMQELDLNGKSVLLKVQKS